MLMNILAEFTGYCFGSLLNPLLWILAISLGLSRFWREALWAAIIFALTFHVIIPVFTGGLLSGLESLPLRVAAEVLMFWLVAVGTSWAQTKRSPGVSQGFVESSGPDVQV